MANSVLNHPPSCKWISTKPPWPWDVRHDVAMADPTDRRLALFVGVLGGPLIVIVGYMISRTLPIIMTDTHLLLLVTLPVLLALPFLVPATTRSRAGYFIIGAVIGVAAVVGIVAGGISLIAWMLSDP